MPVCKRIFKCVVRSPLIRRILLSLSTLRLSFSEEFYSLLFDRELSLHFICAPNIFTGGPLTILMDCLASIPYEMNQRGSRVILICSSDVYHNVSLPPTVHPLCLKLSRSSWLLRLYYERIGFYILSCLCNINTWLSLHDFTSNVRAKHRVTYYHNPAPFWIPELRQIFFAPTMLLWKFLYFPLAAWGIDQNDVLIVQQHWIKREIRKRFPKLSVLVMPPIVGKQLKTNLSLYNHRNSPTKDVLSSTLARASMHSSHEFIFFYPCIPRVFKNIELAIESVLVARNAGFECSLLLTISGKENLYSRFLKYRYSGNPCIKFIGYQTRLQMDALYRSVDALLFTSLLETWGLPLSEAQSYGLPIAAIDLPYVREAVMRYPLLFLSSVKNVIDLFGFHDLLKRDALARHLYLSSPSQILSSEEYPEIDWDTLWQSVLGSRMPSV